MRKRRVTLEFKIGIFIVCGILIFFFFIFSQGKIFHAKWYHVNVLFSNVAGLKEGDPVRVSGYKIGDVKSIMIYYGKIQNIEKPEIKVMLNLSSDLKLGHNSVFTIDSTGLIGEKYVEIIPTGLNDTPLIYPGETVKGISPVSIGEVLNTSIQMIKNFNNLVSSANSTLSSKKFQASLYSIGPNLNTFVQKTTQSLTTFDALAISLQKNSNEIQNILKQNQSGIHQMVSETNKTIKNTDKTIKDADTAVKNISLVAGKTSAHLGEIKNSFVKTSNNLDVLISDLQKTSKDFAQTSKKINALSDNINDTITAINQEKGTLGKLVYDKKLYNELLKFVQEIKKHPSMLLFGK
ncbi:MAG: MlaD family protein [Candidatus Omnitrophica bacterium]|nr:MlaD family protein [Candidatus Omnitrophota bacterium]